MNRAIYDVYRELEVTTAPPEKLIVMMYDGAINSLQQAQIKLMAGDYTAKGAFIGRAISIICELMGSVKSDAGDIGINLRGLYAYFLHRLLDANYNKDEEGINEVIRFLKDLRGAWYEASRRKPNA